MEIAERIKEVCSKSNNQGNGVMPPLVCPYCFGCPIATIVVGIAGNGQQTVARSIAKKSDRNEVNAWLDKVEAKLK